MVVYRQDALRTVGWWRETGDWLLSRLHMRYNGWQTDCVSSHRNADPMCRTFQMSPATQQMQPTQTLQSPPPSGGRRRRVVDEDPDERRRKFLERNRAAATRCRQKRKVWVMSLEKKAEELTQTNMQLQVQIVRIFNGSNQLLKTRNHNTQTQHYCGPQRTSCN